MVFPWFFHSFSIVFQVFYGFSIVFQSFPWFFQSFRRLAGLFGVGGGIVKGPLMLEMGIMPWLGFFHGKAIEARGIYHGKTMGKPWKTMENHGKPWENHGKPWKTMENHGKPWNTMENHGKTMENHGKPWENHGKPWENHGKLWKTMENYGKIMENHGTTMKTRCSPRTRMLTRMLMVQMSKHMDMQSRTTLFCNSLFEQSCTYFPCYQSAVWSGKCRVWSVE